MYIRLVYYSGDRSLVESIVKDASAGIVADKMFFLDAVDNDNDALRFQHNNGSHFDVIFLSQESAQSIYTAILNAVRSNRTILELDIRKSQISAHPGRTGNPDGYVKKIMINLIVCGRYSVLSKSRTVIPLSGDRAKAARFCFQFDSRRNSLTNRADSDTVHKVFPAGPVRKDHSCL